MITTQLPICTIALPSNNVFVPHMAAMMCSILENRKQERFIEFIVLDGGITLRNRELLKETIEKYPHVSVRHLDLEHELKDCIVREPFTKDTFSRLLLDALLPDCDKILYMDTDMIVEDDITVLFDTDVSDVSVAVVFDYVMHAFCTLEIKSSRETGALPSRQYLMNYLGMGENWDRYFQAGTILLNLKKIRETKVFPIMLEKLQSNIYWFLDQDVMNQHFNNDLKFIDPKWNVMNAPEHMIACLPENKQLELRTAMNAPSVIHFAGHEAKPWNNPYALFAEIYWKYLKMTPWYELVQYEMVMKKMPDCHAELQSMLTKNENGVKRFFKRLKRSIKKRLPKKKS